MMNITPNPLDRNKENCIILLSEDHNNNQSLATTNHLAKANNRGTQRMANENISIGKSQKVQKKRKSIQDENNAPASKISMMGSQGLNVGAATSISIFHQVMSETPLRRKNQQEMVSFSQMKEPL